MNKVASLIAATFSSIVGVTIVAVIWTILPILILGAGENYIFHQLLTYSYMVLLVTAIIVLIIGIPAYLILERLGKTSQLNLAIVGFAIPICILLMIMIAFMPDGSGSYSSGQNYYGTYRKMVIDNHRTFWGWVSLIEDFVTYGIYGLVGATIFGKVVSALGSESKNA